MANLYIISKNTKTRMLFLTYTDKNGNTVHTINGKVVTKDEGNQQFLDIKKYEGFSHMQSLETMYQTAMLYNDLDVEHNVFEQDIADIDAEHCSSAEADYLREIKAINQFCIDTMKLLEQIYGAELMELVANL